MATAQQKKGGGRGSRGPAIVRIVSAKKEIAARKSESAVALVGQRQTNVFSKVAGRVTQLAVEEGQPVKAGQTLFRVDRSEPGESYLSVPVTSPISGWVGRWNVTEGTQVSVQDSVVLVVDDRKLIANIYLPVQEWLQVKLNSKVNIRVNELTRPARVLTIARAAEAGSGRGGLTVELDNQDHAFKSGVVALASLELDTRERLLLPASALRISDQGAAVFRIEEGKAKRIKVTYALFNNDQVEILSGISANDQVVSVGAHQLFEGAEVKAEEESLSAAPANGERSERGEKGGRGERGEKGGRGERGEKGGRGKNARGEPKQ
jgi:multidrug efflux pump subunit AcrA (membrane-fusion protein)